MILEGFALYSGTSMVERLGTVNIALPDIEFNKETIRASGVGGDIEIGATGDTKAFKCTIEFLMANKSMFDIMAVQNSLLTLRGSLKDGVTSKPMKVMVYSNPNKAELGKFETGKSMGSKFEFTTHYLYIEIDGKIVFEQDKFNDIFYVNGVDKKLKIKQDLGIV